MVATMVGQLVARTGRLWAHSKVDWWVDQWVDHLVGRRALRLVAKMEHRWVGHLADCLAAPTGNYLVTSLVENSE